MINIGLVCEDEQDSAFLQKCISVFMDKKAEDCIIYSFSNCKQCVYNIIDYDIVFIVLYDNRASVLNTASLLRKSDLTLPIVFLSNQKTDWKTAFSFHAFDFVYGTLNKKKIFTVLNDFFLMICQKNKKRLMLNTEKGTEYIDFDDIYYVIVEKKRTVKVQTAKGSLQAKGTITDISEQLAEQNFYQSRRDCIVNMDYVKSIINDYVIVMKNDDILPLAQKRKKEFLQIFSNIFTDKFELIKKQMIVNNEI